ncbi:MAG: beta-ketoacyl-[Bacteroidales bacterium]|nr:beta-ketoacyl-[acyl-carrier-protein] synthase family protein [Bacteroidales bacterium]
MSSGIAITGMGIISALGIGLDKTYTSLLEKRCPIASPKYLKTVHTNLPCGEVEYSNSQLVELIGEDKERVFPRSALLGIVAARAAEEDACLKEGTKVALISGTTVGGMDITESYLNNFLEGPENSDKIFLHLDGVCNDLIADSLKSRVVYTDVISTACSAAANAIAFGAELIESGRYDVIIAGGTESLTRYHFNGFNSLMILDDTPCRPFDASRKGLNLGEGAGFIVLESIEHAQKRGAKIRGLLSGWGNACDAFHQTASSPDGKGAYLAMTKALKKAGLKPEDIDYVNAHGTGTQNNDLSEGKALMTLFGDKVPYIGSTKCFTGHATSAAAALEAIISLLVIEKRFIPANLRYERGDAELSFSPVTETVTDIDVKNVISNSFGFGGNDTSLIFSKYCQ